MNKSLTLLILQASDLHVRLAAPHQLQPKPDADALSFGKNFTDHMLKVFWHRSLGGWQKPEITPLENLVMHPAAKVLHYAVEVNHFNCLNYKHILWFENDKNAWQIAIKQINRNDFLFSFFSCCC